MHADTVREGLLARAAVETESAERRANRLKVGTEFHAMPTVWKVLLLTLLP